MVALAPDTRAGGRLSGEDLSGKRPMLAGYEVHCDECWRTRRVEVGRTIGNDVRRLSLTAGGEGNWQSSGDDAAGIDLAGVSLGALAGCVDVDLAVTPATNTLPIRRLALPAGKTAAVRAAWVKFPDLDVQPLGQRYTRLAENRYRYESDTGFSAEIEVDDLGLVTMYPGGWERVAEQ